MAPGENLRRLAMMGALVLLATTSAGAGGIELWDWQAVALGASDATKRPQDWSLWCYEVGSGRRLNCSYTLELRYQPLDASALYWNGGHMHSEGRESSELAMGKLTCNGVLAQPPACAGFTYDSKSMAAIVWHEIPQVSGTLTFRATQTFPAGYTCVEPWMCDDETNTTWYLTLYTWYGIEGLKELPASDQYIRCGKADKCFYDNFVFDAHPFPFWAKPQMADAVRALAKKYRAAHPQVKLRILDLSLPAGGLMEDNPETHQWAVPHSWHRVGEGVDIGLWAVSDDGARIDFEPGELVEELLILIKDNNLPLRRVVEPEGRIHFQLKGGLDK